MWKPSNETIRKANESSVPPKPKLVTGRLMGTKETENKPREKLERDAKYIDALRVISKYFFIIISNFEVELGLGTERTNRILKDMETDGIVKSIRNTEGNITYEVIFTPEQIEDFINRHEFIATRTPAVSAVPIPAPIPQQPALPVLPTSPRFIPPILPPIQRQGFIQRNLGKLVLLTGLAGLAGVANHYNNEIKKTAPKKAGKENRGLDEKAKKLAKEQAKHVTDGFRETTDENGQKMFVRDNLPNGMIIRIFSDGHIETTIQGKRVLPERKMMISPDEAVTFEKSFGIKFPEKSKEEKIREDLEKKY